MAIHVVMLKPKYMRLVLRGEKTIECRLSKRPAPPHGQVTAGERLFLKYAGGRFAATAVVDSVDSFDNLRPSDVDALYHQYNHAIRGDGAYWSAKRACAYATLVHLRDVEPLNVGPSYPKSPYKGWFVLDEAKSPLWDVTLTEGALRNRYIRLPGASTRLRSRDLTLELPDGARVVTDLTQGNMVRWRGWGPYFSAYALSPGDVVRLVALEPGWYRVSFRQCQAPRMQNCSRSPELTDA